MRKILLIINTIRFLRWIQIWYLIRYKIKFIRKHREQFSTLREKRSNWEWFPNNAKCTLDGKVFTFIGETHEINCDWNPKNLKKLWLYNLHYHDILCARRSVFSDDKRKELIYNWIKCNPPLDGNGWEPYCLSLRIVNWVKYISSKDTDEIPESWLYSLAEQTNALYWQVEYHIQGNHLFSNAKAFIFSGSLIGGKNGDKWLNLGLKIFTRELSEQFLNDGAHYERSPMYHALMLWDLIDIYQLSRNTGYKNLARLNDILECTISKGIDWLDDICHPDGDISFFNDSAFGVAPKLKEIKNYAAHNFIFHCRTSSTTNSNNWNVVYAKSSGFIAVSNSSIPMQHKAILNIAPIAPSYQPGHAHADTLSFELSLFGKRIFVNSGTSNYQRGELRYFQRSTLAHNTLSVDAKNSSEVWSSFRVAKRTRILSNYLSQKSDCLIAEASHDGFSTLTKKIIHHRKWCFYDNFLRIQDRLAGQFKLATVFFYLHPELEVTECKDQIILHIGGEQMATFLMETEGKLSINKSHWYPEFGKSVKNSCLKIETEEKIIDVKILWKN